MGRLKTKWSWFVHTTLFVLVAASLGLTFSILDPPVQIINWFQEKNTDADLTATNIPANTQATNVSLTEIFAAETLTIHSGVDKYDQVNSKEVLMAAQQFILPPAQVNPDMEVNIIEEADFREQIANKKYMEVEYADLVPARFLVNSITNLPNRYHEMTFNSLIYVENSDYFAFINEIDNEVYQINMDNLDQKKLWDLMTEQADQFIAVEPYTIGEGRQYLSTSPVTVDKLTYMIEQQSNSTFLNVLFTSPREIQDFSDNHFVRYYAEGQNLVINTETYELEYNQEISDETEMSAVEMIEASFDELRRKQLVTDDFWYYMNYNDKLITYRKFINNLPVFGQNNVSKIQFGMQADQVSTLRMSTMMLQTPLTDRSQQYTLMSGEKAYQLLEASQTPISEVQSIRIGYTWLPSSESSRLIELVPAWYVKVAEHWYLLERLVDMQRYPDSATINKTTGKAVYMADLYDASQAEITDSDSAPHNSAASEQQVSHDAETSSEQNVQAQGGS